MASNVLPPMLLLLLVLFTPGLGTTPTLALVEDCNAADKVVAAGEILLIQDTQDIEDLIGGNSYGNLLLSVMTEPGFAGFHVNVTSSDGSQYLAWFPEDRDCFPLSDQWYGIWLEVLFIEDWNQFRIWFNTDSCKMGCQMNTTLQDMWAFSVTAYGASKWWVGRPNNSCDYVHWKLNKMDSFPICTGIKSPAPDSMTPELLTTTTTTTPEPPSTITTITATTPEPPVISITTMIRIYLSVSVVVTAVVVVAVQALVRHIRKRRRQQSEALWEPASPSQPTEPAVELNTTDN